MSDVVIGDVDYRSTEHFARAPIDEGSAPEFTTDRDLTIRPTQISGWWRRADGEEWQLSCVELDGPVGNPPSPQVHRQHARVHWAGPGRTGDRFGQPPPQFEHAPAWVQTWVEQNGPTS